MKILLLANQPERTVRLRMFMYTLKRLGYDVIVPRFTTRNWVEIAKQAKSIIESEKPDVVHIFNVPDIIYHGIPRLKGSSFDKLIYDYRSPWGIESQISFGPLARNIGERFERELAMGADLITSVNAPLGDKVTSYVETESKPLFIIPNYPFKSFTAKTEDYTSTLEADQNTILFVGRVSRHEGIGNLMRLIKEIPEYNFWIVGDGPFAKWHLRNISENARFFGWQPHEKVAQLIACANLCLITLGESLLTPYATDKSVWKLNEYLDMEKIVVASGVTKEEDRKNLIVVKNSDMKDAIINNMNRRPESMNADDFRYWESNHDIIKKAYEDV